MLLSERSQFLNKLSTLEARVDLIGHEFILRANHLGRCMAKQRPAIAAKPGSCPIRLEYLPARNRRSFKVLRFCIARRPARPFRFRLERIGKSLAGARRCRSIGLWTNQPSRGTIALPADLCMPVHPKRSGPFGNLGVLHRGTSS